MNSETKLPELAPPGAGLPLLEGLFARYVFYPTRMLSFSWKGSLKELQDETARIKALAAPLTEDELYTRQLIKRLPGLEDSSRYWSVGMTIQHLMISMKWMSYIVSQLSAGNIPEGIPGTAMVKPPEEERTPKETLLADFDALTAEIVKNLSQLEPKAADNHKKQAHPFFGALTSRGWVWVLGMHQSLHRKQIELILAGLKQA